MQITINYITPQWLCHIHFFNMITQDLIRLVCIAHSALSQKSYHAGHLECFVMDREALAKQGDNALGSVRLSVCPSVCALLLVYFVINPVGRFLCSFFFIYIYFFLFFFCSSTGWRLQPTLDSCVLVSPPPMSSRLHNLEPSGRWHATICIWIMNMSGISSYSV